MTVLSILLGILIVIAITGYFVAQEFGLTVVRRRIIRVDDVPVQLSDRYYPASLAQGTELARPQRMRGYTMAALERLGVEVDHFLDDLYLRMPTQQKPRSCNSAREHLS